MAWQDASGHRQDVGTVKIALLAIVGDHGENVFIVLTGQQSVPGDDDGLIVVVDNHGGVTRHVSLGYQKLQAVGQGVPRRSR